MVGVRHAGAGPGAGGAAITVAARERRDEGAVAVEFALLFPLLFFLLFGTLIFGWRVWEHQAGQAAAGDATRLASLGISSLDSYRHDVICVGEQDGLRGGSLTRLEIIFLNPTTMKDSGQALSGGFVQTKLTYTSAFNDFPFPGFGSSGDGTFVSSAVGPIEQLGTVTSDQTITISGERCG